MDKRRVFTFFIINLSVSLLVSDYFRNFAPAKKVITK